MTILTFLGQSCPALTLNTFVRHEMLIDHHKKEDIKFLKREYEFSKTQDDAIHFHPGHLKPKMLMFTLKALVEQF